MVPSNPSSATPLPTRRSPLRYGGIVLGSLYGILLRLAFERGGFIGDLFSGDLFTITFIWIVPIVIGIIPLWFASDKQLRSASYTLGAPVLAVLGFFACALFYRLEDILCLLVIAAPFLLGALVAGELAARWLRRYRKKKGMILGLAALPLLLMTVESSIKPVMREERVTTVVHVKAAPEKIWENIVRVAPIADAEYQSGFFQWAGVPRPMYAELDRDILGGKRVGHFEEGLTFNEQVTDFQRGRRLALSIVTDKNSLRDRVMDRHILKGEHFSFVSAIYDIEPLDGGNARLRLTCTYRLKSNINAYASLWGDLLVSDFQQRLLQVIRNRCEQRP